MNDRTIVIDFETTGLSAKGGDRAIEVGAVALENGVITERFQSLINPGFRVDSFIENYTQISNAMLSDAPDCRQVMPQLQNFIGDSVLVAHNASFDRGFLEMEYAQLGFPMAHAFLCSMRVARRIYPNAPNHRLGTLVDYTQSPNTGQFHRALADAEMTAYVWLAMLAQMRENYRIADIDLALLQKLQGVKIASAPVFLQKWALGSN